MNGITQLKQKAIERLADMDLEKMGMGEMNAYLDLVNKVAGIQDHNYMDDYAQMIKELIPGKREERPLEAFDMASTEKA